MTRGREDSADARPGGANRRPCLTEGTMGRNRGVLNSRKAPFDLLSKYHLGAPCMETDWTALERVRAVGQEVTTMTRPSDGSHLS